jgi:hypothetical protein
MAGHFRRSRAIAAALALATACGMALPAPAEGEPAVEPLLQEQVEIDRAAIASQQRIDQLSDETREMLLQYRQYLSETRSLNEYADALAVQVEAQADEIALVQRQLVEIETTTREVLPLMQKMLDILERFVRIDLPFQMEERRKRIATLKDTMNRADVTISEKYRRIIEAYQIETDYGRTLEAYQGELGEGGDARTVRFLRVGRIALLYQTLDGEETGYWDAGQKRFVADASYRSAARQGFAVADKVGAPDLLTAPIPAPVAVRP